VSNKILLFLCWLRMEGVWHFLSYTNLELVFFYSSTRSVEWLIPLRFILLNNNQIITAFHQSYFIQQYKETYIYNNKKLQCFWNLYYYIHLELLPAHAENRIE
jgi:hypothetical protein